MPTTVGYAHHCRLHIHASVGSVSALLKPCSVEPLVWRGHNKGSNKVRKPVSCLSSQQSPLQDTQSAPPSRAALACPHGYQIRRAKPDEADQVAELNAEAFAWLASKNMASGLLKRYTEPAEIFYQQSIYQDSSRQLKRALHEKQQAQRGAREAMLRRQSRKLRADIARLQGQPVPALPLEDRLQSPLSDKRHSLQGRDDRVIMRLLQLLPAPFPTTKPWRLYCSNMAVATAHRRQGLATALLHHCQRVGALWGHTEIWLHVDIVNKQAQTLYMGSGFGINSQDSWYYILSRKRYLMQKALPETQKRALNDGTQVAGGSARSDGVFVWDVQPDSNSDRNTVGTSTVDAASDPDN